MYERILFPTDGSEQASAAFEYVLDVAADTGATVHVLNVADTAVESVTNVRGEVVDALELEGERLVEAAGERAEERGVDVVTEILQGDPSTTIVGYADEFDVDLVVMPTQGRRGLGRALLGSVTERVVTAASAPVLVVNPDATEATGYPVEDVLVPSDGSPEADRALSAAIPLATANDATLHLLSVVESPTLGPLDWGDDEPLVERAEDIVSDATARAEDAGLTGVTSAVERGEPYREIRSYVEATGVDLVVLGLGEDTDFSRYLMGSVSTKLLRTSPVPVLTVRSSDDGNTAADDTE